MRSTPIEVQGVRFERFKCQNMRLNTHRIIWAKNQERAQRLAAKYAGTEPECIDVYPAPLLLDLEPMTERQLKAMEQECGCK